MTEQLNNQESYMDRCKEAAIEFSLKIAELVEVDTSNIDRK